MIPMLTENKAQKAPHTYDQRNARSKSFEKSDKPVNEFDWASAREVEPNGRVVPDHGAGFVLASRFSYALQRDRDRWGTYEAVFDPPLNASDGRHLKSAMESFAREVYRVSQLGPTYQPLTAEELQAPTIGYGPIDGFMYWFTPLKRDSQLTGMILWRDRDFPKWIQ